VANGPCGADGRVFHGGARGFGGVFHGSACASRSIGGRAAGGIVRCRCRLRQGCGPCARAGGWPASMDFLGSLLIFLANLRPRLRSARLLPRLVRTVRGTSVIREAGAATRRPPKAGGPMEVALRRRPAAGPLVGNIYAASKIAVGADLLSPSVS